MLSEYQLRITDLQNISIGNVKKLVPNFFDDEKYVIHYENVNLCFRLGLKLKKIHRVLESNQSRWLKPYIEFNTHKKIKAEKNNDKDENALYKVMNNAIYGKTMKNLRNRIDVKLISNEKKLFKIYIKAKLYVALNIWQ